MLAIIEAHRAGLLKPKHWFPNLIAGIIVAIVALPLAMAFAIASGVKPEQGLYTAIIAAFMVGIFGGSRVQIAGPTGAFVIILANITAQYGENGLLAASLMAGIILLFMGFLKLGSVIKFIPDPVIVGFTTGIAVIIFVGEWKDFFGLSMHLPLDANFYLKITELLKALPHLNLTTTMLGLLSLILVLITPRFFKRIPGPLVAMVAVTLLQTLFHFQGVATIGTAFGGIPQHLPHLQFPNFSNSLNLIGPAFTIALLGAIESLLSATAADGMMGVRHNANQELIGQGLANIFAPLFGGFAATGAIARTATNIRSGGNSPIAAIVHSFVLILVLLLLAPLAANIPLSTLAAILFVVAYNMSDVSHFVRTFKYAPYYDVLILLVTFLLTVSTNLVIAVNVGVVLAMLFFVRRMHQSVIVEQLKLDALQTELETNNMPHLPTDMIIYTIQGPFFFGAAEKIEHALAITHNDPKIIIFRLKDIPFMDMTGLETFNELLEHYYKRGVEVYLCEANQKVIHKLTNMNVLQWCAEKRIFTNIAEVLKFINSKRVNKDAHCVTC